MQEMSREEFERQKNDAARRIREIYKGQNMPPYPDFISLPAREKEIKTEETVPPKTPQKSPPQTVTGNLFKFLNFSELLKSPDALLILGLIFLLLSDNADEKLILALVFIML